MPDRPEKNSKMNTSQRGVLQTFIARLPTIPDEFIVRAITALQLELRKRKEERKEL